jgi:hypothetical protein
MTKHITDAKKIQKKSRAHQVISVNGHFQVTSGSSNKTYQVTPQGSGYTCSCDWGQYRRASDPRSGCSHVVSVVNHLTQVAGSKVMAWASEEEAARQHRPTINLGDGVTLTVRKR